MSWWLLKCIERQSEKSNFHTHTFRLSGKTGGRYTIEIEQHNLNFYLNFVYCLQTREKKGGCSSPMIDWINECCCGYCCAQSQFTEQIYCHNNTVSLRKYWQSCCIPENISEINPDDFIICKSSVLYICEFARVNTWVHSILILILILSEYTRTHLWKY